MHNNKELSAVANINAINSIYRIHRRYGDEGPFELSGTKGFAVRQQHINNFIKSKHDFILLLDRDQVFQPDILDRLRSHRLPYVSGYYMFRSSIPRPIWFKWQPKNRFPMVPYYEIPPKGKLVKLGASGWGCILVHRAVFEAVKPLLKGEPEIIEDDMDLWPYNLERILVAIKKLEKFGEQKEIRNEVIKTLREEIRPLRIVKDNIGSDLRFPFFAREAGFTLWGDPDARCGHLIDYAVSPDDFEQMDPEIIKKNHHEWSVKMIKKERNRLAKAYKEMLKAVENG